MNQSPALLLISLVLCCLSTTTAAGPVYRWVDQFGVTHFSEAAPPVADRDIERIDLPPPPPPVSPETDYYSVVNQARRMTEERLRREQARAEWLQAEAEARRAEAELEAARQADRSPPEEAQHSYFYPLPVYGRRHHRHRPPSWPDVVRLPHPSIHRGEHHGGKGTYITRDHPAYPAARSSGFRTIPRN